MPDVPEGAAVDAVKLYVSAMTDKNIGTFWGHDFRSNLQCDREV